MKSPLQASQQVHLKPGGILYQVGVDDALVRLSEAEADAELLHQLPVLF